jgi:hypothetical protein
MTEVEHRSLEELRQLLIERYREIDGQVLRRLMEAGLLWLRTNQATVNHLNVFPVPDGDTGTNMVLTLQSAVDEASDLRERSVGNVAHALAHGALLGARGNSGVILSQLLRGFARVLDARPTMDARTFVAALAEARDTAYRGVVMPVEGTILTVAKDIAQAAEEGLAQGGQAALRLLERVVEAGDASVQRTPDLLPELKKAGVVDAGGKGLFFILEGALRHIYGLPLDKPLVTVAPLGAELRREAAEAAEPGQDWEVIVDFQPGPRF